MDHYAIFRVTPTLDKELVGILNTLDEAKTRAEELVDRNPYKHYKEIRWESLGVYLVWFGFAGSEITPCVQIIGR